MEQSQELSKSRTVILFFVSLFEMTLFSAPLLGWPSLIIILKEEQIASHLCQNVPEFSVQNGSQSTNYRSYSLCAEQEKSLNLSHNIAVMVMAVHVFLAGWAIDRYGAKAVKIFSSAILSVSAVFFMFTSSKTPEYLTPALVTMGIANIGLMVSIIKSTVLYDKWQSTANSMFWCAVTSSAVTFLTFKVLYDHGVTYQVLFQILLYSSLALLLSSIVIFPNINQHDQSKPSKRNPDKPHDQATSQRFKHLKEIMTLMKSGIFVVTCLFIGMCRLRLFFFATTFQQFILALPNTDMQTVTKYSDFYGLTQLCSLALCPLVGGLVTTAVKMSRRSSMRHQEITMVTSQSSCQCKVVVEIDVVTAARAAEIRGCTVYYACSGLLLILISLLTIIPNVQLQILSFLILTLLRCFYNGGFSNLFLVAFPSQHFGKLFGIGGFVCSLIQMLQLPIFHILETYFPMEIMKFNLSFLLVSIPLGLGYPCYLWYFARRLGSKSRNTSHACDYEVEKLLYERVTVL